jgi:hypothetical protein
MGIFSFISNIFKPAVDLVDNLHTNEEEKLILERELRKVEYEFNSKSLAENWHG